MQLYEHVIQFFFRKKKIFIYINNSYIVILNCCTNYIFSLCDSVRRIDRTFCNVQDYFITILKIAAYFIFRRACVENTRVRLYTSV